MTVLAMLGAVFIISVYVHELGHAWAGRLTGRKVLPVQWRWHGPVVPVEVGNVKTMWVVALAGPATSFFLSMLAWPLVELPGTAGVIFWAAWVINLDFALVNLIPVWKLDGRWVLRSLRA